jgi:transcriptional regulator with XRE-family HTH domain
MSVQLDLLDDLDQVEQMARDGIAGVPPPNFLAAFVRFQRAMRQWKQETLAHFAKVSLATVQRIERGMPVSTESLNRVALALGYEPGDFTEPRVPLSRVESAERLNEMLKRFEGLQPVSVRPLRTMTQVADLLRAETLILYGDQLGEEYQDDLAELHELMDCYAFVLDDKIRIKGERIRRRQTYHLVLKEIRHIEKMGRATTLVGIYTADTDCRWLPKARVALLAFFPKLTDPGAVKRQVLLAPKRVELIPALRDWLASG